ncbi:hypothetical protein PIROE2DRAFT_12450 [Piromyces sp. E2]|nr:hypothetical protein PIROE2DRAFT_12450 [Piromyces sp. E2]|eukprot:OUM61537.1 hypothetical protein PIROE2DRAFT_12450 [Piromyces sp. E2]
MNSDGTDGNLILIIDGFSFFYEMGKNLNYFPLDYKLFIKELQEKINLLLSIKGLQKIIFVFDGVDDPSKKKIKNKRDKDRIHSVKNLNKRIFNNNRKENNKTLNNDRKVLNDQEMKEKKDNHTYLKDEDNNSIKDNNKNFIFDLQIQNNIHEYENSYFHNKEKIKNNNKHPYFGYTTKLCPSPIELTTYIQYIISLSKINQKLKVKIEINEADNSIAKLAKEEKGFVLSTDSDFYMYDIPGFIDLSSINFININQGISYQLYTIDVLENYLGFSKELFPLYASLVGNDFIYPKYKSINKLINEFNIENNNDVPINNKFMFLENIKLYIQAHQNIINQDSFINKILQYVSENEKEDIYIDFKNCLYKSLNHYIINNENKKEFANSFGISSELLNSYSDGKIHSKLLNIITNESYSCTQYFEIINEGNCWDITDELRKEMYKLLLMRNYHGIGNNNNNTENINKIITEYKRKKDDSGNINSSGYMSSSGYLSSSENEPSTDNKYGNEDKHEMIENKINININKNEYIPSDINDRFNIYLDAFNSNTLYIKALPYYLIPLASSLRYYLNEKLKSNHFIYTDNRDSNTILSINEICDYEFEALVASSIAALTLTFLNINIYKKYNNIPGNTTTTIEKNIEYNHNQHINNFFKNKQRLELQRKLNRNQILELMKDKSNNFQFKRQTQILAEFRNVLAINSNMMQILKLTDDLPDFQYIATMHHYIWEEAFHRLIYQIKKDFFQPTIKNITTLFKKLFYIDGINNKDENFTTYLKYLNENYHLVLNSKKKKN